MDILQSEPFCLLLAHMTGLDLAHNVIRSANSHTKLANENEEEYSEKGAKPTGASNQGTGAKQSEERVNSSVGVEQPPQEDSSTENNETDAISEAPPLSLPAECPGEAATAAAECRCDLYRWQCGDYTLAGDESDPGYGKFCLDAVLSMSCEGGCFRDQCMCVGDLRKLVSPLQVGISTKGVWSRTSLKMKMKK